MIGFTATGGDAMQARMKVVARRLNFNAGAALYRRGEAIMTRSKTEFVPVKFGRLKNSGRVSTPQWYGNRWEVELKYGGPEAPYAIIQHETPHFKHRVGRWKYLETPMKEASATIMPMIAAEMTMGV